MSLQGQKKKNSKLLPRWGILKLFEKKDETAIDGRFPPPGEKTASNEYRRKVTYVQSD